MHKSGLFVRKVLVFLFLLTALFPYTQLLPIETYTQPYAFFSGFLLFLLIGWKQLIRLPIIDSLALIIFAVTGIIFYIFNCLSEFSQQDIKYLLNYISPLIFATGFYYILSKHPIFARKTIEYSALTWLIVGLIQLTIDTTFATFLVGDWQDAAQVVVDSGRGVLGLAPEPTHFGFHLVLTASLLILTGGHKYLIMISLLGSLLLAQSSSVLLSFIIGIILIGILKPKNFIKIIFIILYFILIAITINTLNATDIRILQLLSIFIENPTQALMLDGSVNSRLGGLIAAASTIINQGFFPNGLSHAEWLKNLPQIEAQFPWLNQLSNSGWPSGYLLVIYQTGLVGLLFITIILHKYNQLSFKLFHSIVISSGLSIFLFQYNISTPIFGIIYGAMIYNLKYKNLNL